MEIINLHQLEHLPDLAFIEIVKNLEPKSLVRLCSTSKAIREKCRGMWRYLYRRDISKFYPPCENPNWKKLYVSSVTGKLPIYYVIFGSTDTIEMYGIFGGYTIRYASSLGDVDRIIFKVLQKNYNFTRKEVENFLDENYVGIGNPVEINDIDSVLVEKRGEVDIRPLFEGGYDKELKIYEIEHNVGYFEDIDYALGDDELRRTLEMIKEENDYDYDVEEEIATLKDIDNISIPLSEGNADLFVYTLMVLSPEEIKETILSVCQ